MISATQSTSIITALEQIGSPEHLCSIYEKFSVTIPFIHSGLAPGEKNVSAKLMMVPQRLFARRCMGRDRRRARS
jgi:hypothetical protein